MSFCLHLDDFHRDPWWSYLFGEELSYFHVYYVWSVFHFSWAALFLYFLLVMQFLIFFLFLTASFVENSDFWFSWFTVIIILCCGQTSKRLLQFILNLSVLFPCSRGHFVTVLNFSSNIVFLLQTDLFKPWFFISNCIMVFFDKFSCSEFNFVGKECR